MRITIPFKAIPLCLAILLSLCSDTFSQDLHMEANKLHKLGDSLRLAKQHKMAAQHYRAEGKLRKMTAFKREPAINASLSYAMAQMIDSAMVFMESAVKDYGYIDIDWLDSDPSFSEVRKLKRFARLKKYMIDRKNAQHDPDKAQIVTSDIDLFWKVYDRYKLDTSKARQLFLTEYFEKGSLSLQEYYRIKTPNIGGLNGFIHNMATMPEFYASIRANTLRTVTLKDTFRLIFKNMAHWYKPSIFPTANFLIGGWSAGGTVVEYGSIMGVDMSSCDDKTKTDELNLWQKQNLLPFKEMKHLVAHELIHVQQSQMAGDTTLLCHTIQEGMADFIGELISGKTANQRLHVWAVGHERQVWEEFKKEMFLDRYSNWIANSNQETAERPSDLGYWVGYQICKAYFDQATDKKQSIHDMLNIQDYRAFLTKSKVDERLMGK
jgi:hypothetical protein